eukprot:6507680-Lingulodinium_polyedra.AAC.1
MWYQFPGKWRYMCQVVWEPLVMEVAKHPEDPLLQEWVNDLTTKWGARHCAMASNRVRQQLHPIEEGSIDGHGDPDKSRGLVVIHGRQIAIPIGRRHQGRQG